MERRGHHPRQAGLHQGHGDQQSIRLGASPKLITIAATKSGAPKAVLTLRKAGRDQQEFLVITMSNVLISSYIVGGASGSDGVLENVVLNLELIDGAYKKQKPDGSLGPAIPWNIAPSAGKCANND